MKYKIFGISNIDRRRNCWYRSSQKPLLYRRIDFFLLSFQFILLATTVVLVNGYRSEDAYITIPTGPTFNDRSALADKKNLQSIQYHDFIHNLYRFDKDNLQKVDKLFDIQNSASIQNSPSVEPYHHQRYKRAIYFRPLFVYRQQTVQKRRTWSDNRRLWWFDWYEYR